MRLIDRRPDGYHDIETVFVPLRLYDRLEIARQAEAGVRLECSGDARGVPSDASNLAVRAARALQERGFAPPGLRVRIEKRIPAAAGLGGGSSDAAAVILGVEALGGRPIPDPDRTGLARDLGADVPFFLRPCPSVAHGIGDRLRPLEGIPEMWWILACFPFGISTAEVYAAASRELTLPRRGSSIAALVGSWGIRTSPPNDLEGIATRLHPEIGEARLGLERAGATATGMTGSGPTVYGRFDSREKAEQSARGLRLPEGARPLVANSPGSGSQDWRWGVAKW